MNEARLKIDRMGGIEEYRKRQKQAKMRRKKYQFDESLLYRLEEYIESDEFKELDKYDKNEILKKKREAEKMSERIENGEFDLSDQEEDESEFTMEELYKQTGLDYKLVYGSHKSI
ncbi:unnamed protein product [Ambrosiozyma monospora]|uniref:Unnamed protein product n=1 Tax=Ambrosiozyma monospora TaxID=43982 RepID=A0ACB5UAU4_AMBMO|nr:unnamed protein product [Ambrosiozyma monospora]